MARIVVWAKPDNDCADPVRNARKFKRGMVVEVREDGEFLGNDVEKGSWWRVIEAPGPAADYAYLLEADPKFLDERLFVSEPQYPRKRKVALDLDAIEAAAGLAPLEKPDRAIPLTTKADVVAAETAVASLENANVISQTEVIG
jgi:hypothetical protein